MSHIQPHTQIEDYLKGKLSGDALSDFERQLNTSPDLAKEVQIHRELYSHFNDEVPDYQLDTKKKQDLYAYTQSKEVQAFQEKLKSAKQSFYDREIPVKPAKVRSLRWIYAAVASILFLIGGYFLFNQNSMIPPDALYASMITHERLSTTEMGTASETLQTIENNFNQKNYAEVLKILPNFLSNLSETDKLANSDALVATQGRWYAVLTHLKKGDTSKFKSTLAEYINKRYTYKRDQALQLQKNASMW